MINHRKMCAFASLTSDSMPNTDIHVTHTVFLPIIVICIKLKLFLRISFENRCGYRNGSEGHTHTQTPTRTHTHIQTHSNTFKSKYTE